VKLHEERRCPALFPLERTHCRLRKAKRLAQASPNRRRICRHHEESQIALQLISAVPHGTYVECFADPERDPVWQRMWLNRPPAKDGIMAVAQGAGFGLELDQAMIGRYAVG
jgi:hypothetical protein